MKILNSKLECEQARQAYLSFYEWYDKIRLTAAYKAGKLSVKEQKEISALFIDTLKINGSYLREYYKSLSCADTDFLLLKNAVFCNKIKASDFIELLFHYQSLITKKAGIV